MDELWRDFIQPFKPEIERKKLQVALKIKNEISNGACTDWTIYKEILYHLMQNAIKFSTSNTEIKVTVAYCAYSYAKKTKKELN